MHCTVINLDTDRVAIVLLFVKDVVLGACNDTSALDSLDCLCHGDTGKVRVRAVDSSDQNFSDNIRQGAYLKPSQFLPP
jgi:hypothetical protein